jgi:hypothetical protein
VEIAPWPSPPFSREFDEGGAGFGFAAGIIFAAFM